MIYGGFIIIIVSLAIMFVPPGHSRHPSRRGNPQLGVGRALRSAYPIAPSHPPFVELIARADEVLDCDALLHGVRGVAASYDQA